ncbi:MAG: T9SS type A sorting domain-containing protein [Chitinophagales bacterium]|nr:T9SS type A sorting domain-containing protein [Chitinophagales bacterium]
MMKKIFVYIYFSMMLLPALQARIEILSLSPTTPGGGCTGTVEIIASGNAAPFTVSVLETGQIYSNIEGVFQITGLCEGAYSISVSPTNLPGCATILNPVILVDNSAIPPPGTQVSSDEEEGQSNLSLSSQFSIDQSSLNFSFDLYPNPAGDFVNIYIHSQESSAIYQLNFLNAIGQQIFESSTSAHELTKFNLKGLSPGIYFMEVVNTNGESTLKKVIVQ